MENKSSLGLETKVILHLFAKFTHQLSPAELKGLALKCTNAVLLCDKRGWNCQLSLHKCENSAKERPGAAEKDIQAVPSILALNPLGPITSVIAVVITVIINVTLYSVSGIAC